MEDIDDIEDTGSIGDLDETDQLPVKVTGEASNPICYICNQIFTIWNGKNLRAGVYSDEAMMTDWRCYEKNQWDRYYRMILLHRRKRICRLSGISCFNTKDLGFHTRQAPWDENTGIVRSESKPSKHKDLLATALQHEAQHLFVRDRLTCLVFHARCWQLLCMHKVWSFSGGNLRIVMQALRRKSARYWKQPLYSLEEVFDAWEIIDDQEDPFVCYRAEFIIRRARRRAHKRFQVIRYDHEETYLGRLPPEILLLIANLLPSTDVAAAQKAMGSYLGDAYWRSRIPGIFHEARDVSSETLDWEYVCFELEKLELEYNEELDSRRYVLGHLDEIAGLIADDSNNT